MKFLSNWIPQRDKTPHANDIMMLAYWLLSLELSVLYFSTDGNLGIRIFESYFPVRWYWLIGSFVLCGFVLRKPRTVRTFIVCTLPLIGYFAILGIASIRGDMSPAAILPATYGLIAVAFAVMLIISEVRIDELGSRITNLEDKARAIAKDNQ